MMVIISQRYKLYVRIVFFRISPHWKRYLKHFVILHYQNCSNPGSFSDSALGRVPSHLLYYISWKSQIKALFYVNWWYFFQFYPFVVMAESVIPMFSLSWDSCSINNVMSSLTSKFLIIWATALIPVSAIIHCSNAPSPAWWPGSCWSGTGFRLWLSLLLR